MKLMKAVIGLAMTGLSIAALAQEEPNRVVLITPEFTLTTKDFHYFIDVNVPEQQRKSALAQEGAVKSVFENMYVSRMFAAKAEESGKVDKERIDWMVGQYRDRLLMNTFLDAEVEQALAEADWDALAREEYQARRDQFKAPETVSVNHILIDVKERTKEEAEQRATEVLSMLEDGAEFEELATEYSDDAGTKARGGSLGFFGKGRMVKPFEDAAFAMTRPGELSGLVETQFGYHILRFNDRRPERQMDFDEVKARILPEIEKKRTGEVRSELIALVRSGEAGQELQINLEILDELEARYAEAEDSAE